MTISPHIYSRRKADSLAIQIFDLCTDSCKEYCTLLDQTWCRVPRAWSGNILDCRTINFGKELERSRSKYTVEKKRAETLNIRIQPLLYPLEYHRTRRSKPANTFDGTTTTLSLNHPDGKPSSSSRSRDCIHTVMLKLPPVGRRFDCKICAVEAWQVAWESEGERSSLCPPSFNHIWSLTPGTHVTLSRGKKAA